MGLKVNTLAEFPESIHRSYYMYILDYYNWDEPIGNTLRKNFDRIAEFSAENDSIVIEGIRESHFYTELLSWKSINGIDPKELLPALMITSLHPTYFLERNVDFVDEFNENLANHSRGINKKSKMFPREPIPEDKLIFIKISEICKTPSDVINLLQKIFRDIKEKKEIADFVIKSELKSGVGKILNDAIILEPNIGGIGINLNQIFKYLGKKK